MFLGEIEISDEGTLTASENMDNEDLLEAIDSGDNYFIVNFYSFLNIYTVFLFKTDRYYYEYFIIM